MSQPSRPDERGGLRPAPVRLALHVALYAFLWLVLSGNRGWLAGAPVILLAAWLGCLTSAAPRWSLAALAAFVPYFAVNSLRGGIDVAWRALHPALPIEPGLIRYDLTLRTTGARVLMANAVTLQPGTLSADLDGAALQVHVLNAGDDHLDALRDLERRVRQVCEPGGAGAAA